MICDNHLRTSNKSVALVYYYPSRTVHDINILQAPQKQEAGA